MTRTHAWILWDNMAIGTSRICLKIGPEDWAWAARQRAGMDASRSDYAAVVPSARLRSRADAHAAHLRRAGGQRPITENNGQTPNRGDSDSPVKAAAILALVQGYRRLGSAGLCAQQQANNITAQPAVSTATVILSSSRELFRNLLEFNRRPQPESSTAGSMPYPPDLIRPPQRVRCGCKPHPTAGIRALLLVTEPTAESDAFRQ